MKNLLLIICLLVGIDVIAQNYTDLFTTYQDASTQSTQPQRKQTPTYQTPSNNSYVPQYQVMDAQQFFQSVAPQNVQIVTGVYQKGAQFYSIKMKVGVSGTNTNQIVVTSYWNGQTWNNSAEYASPVGYGVPEQLKNYCQYQVYISGLGTVYF